VAATVAREIHRLLPGQGARLSSVTEAAARLEADDLVLAVFSVKNGAYAPIVPFYQELRDKKVAFLAVLCGPVDASRVRKTVWAIKKQFCGNQVLGGYLCPALDDQAWGLSTEEMNKVINFSRKLYDDHIAFQENPMAVNY